MESSFGTVAIDRSIEIVEKTLNLLSQANGRPVKVLARKEATAYERANAARSILLKHSLRLIPGLKVILGEDKLHEWQRRRELQVKNEGEPLKQFAEEHLKSGYPQIYQQLEMHRELRRKPLETEPKGPSVEQMERWAKSWERSYMKRIYEYDLSYQRLRDAIRALEESIKIGTPLAGKCQLCSDLRSG